MDVTFNKTCLVSYALGTHLVLPKKKYTDTTEVLDKATEVVTLSVVNLSHRVKCGIPD